MQNNLALNETYFSFCGTIPAELVELWNWFCFEKGVVGTGTLQESSWTITDYSSIMENLNRTFRKTFGVD